MRRAPVTSLILALDLPTAEAAVATAETVADHVDGFAVGPGLLFGPGPLIISALVRLGKPVVADARLLDSPDRTQAAARQLGKHGARWITAHIAGGREMLAAAIEGLTEGAGGAPSGVLGVTVLPFLDPDTLKRVGIDRTPGKLVAQRAKVAAKAGCEGVICPPSELAVVRDSAPSMLRIADLAGAPTETVPTDLADRGADAVIVDASVTGARDSVAAAQALFRAIRGTPTDG